MLSINIEVQHMHNKKMHVDTVTLRNFYGVASLLYHKNFSAPLCQ